MVHKMLQASIGLAM